MKVSALSSYPSTSRHRFRIQRAFKALDDGKYKKWVFVIRASDLPLRLPLDGNARMPNILKNDTCREMRETLLYQPELFQVLNGGTICTGSVAEISEANGEKFVELAFDPEAQQGIVNGGHTYATLLHVLREDTAYADGKDLKAVLARDAKKGNAKLMDLVDDEEELSSRLEKAREKAFVQLEFVQPISDSEELEQIARARNLSQSVEATALANLAGKFELMKEVLSSAQAPFPSLERRVVWKTNQEVGDDGKAISVKTLINLVTLMNIRKYPIDTRPAYSVYGHASVVVREFAEAEGEAQTFQNSLVKLLPKFIELHDLIYSTLPEIDSEFPWATGKFNTEVKTRRRKTSAATPLLNRPCGSKVLDAFVLPIFASLRALLREDSKSKSIEFQSDPCELFHEMKRLLADRTMSYHRDHGALQHVGKDKEIWLRLDMLVTNELAVRSRLEKAS